MPRALMPAPAHATAGASAPPTSSDGLELAGPDLAAERGLVGAGHPGGEGLAVVPLVEERLDHVGDVVVQAGAGHLVGTELLAEPRVQPEAAAEVDLEALDLVAGRVQDQLALEADVGDLRPRAGVRAAVDVDADRHGQVREPVLELGDQVGGALLGLDNRELAELDAGAGHRAASPGGRLRRETDRLEACDQVVDLVRVDAEHDQLLVRREPGALGAVRLDEVAERAEQPARHAADRRCRTDVEAAVLLGVHADVVAAAGRQGRGGAVDQGPAEVLLLEHLPELRDAPVGDQELEAGAGAQSPVAVVPEHRDHGLPGIGDLVERDPDAHLLREHRVGGEPAADPEVEPRAELGVHGADEGDVVDLRRGVEAGVSADRGLELAREVGVLRIADVAPLDLLERGRAVDDLVGRDARHRGAEEAARRVPTGLLRLQADGLEPLPDRGDVLDPDPVVLDVLAVGEVGGVAGEVGGDAAEDPQLLGTQQAAVAAHPQHEVLVIELLGVERSGLAAVETWLALGVEAPPAEPAAQVAAVDGGEAAMRVDVLDPGPHVQRVVVLLGLLVGVQRLPVPERPLALAALLPGTAGPPGTAGAGAGGGLPGVRGFAGRCHEEMRSWDERRTMRSSTVDVVVEVSPRTARPAG